MADKSLQLALRIKADLEQGQAELKQLAAALGNAGTAAQQANAQLGSISKATDQLAAGSAAAATAARSVGAASAATVPGLAQQASAMKQAGISAGQYQMAMRQLPAQMTDVVTSLASGMPIWMVAIQQGGQIRDSFGGIGAAARALVSTISPLALGIAAAAAGIGVLGGAVLSAISEINDLNKALLTTGGAAGMTVDGIRSLTEELAGGRHYSQAADAMMAVVSSGKLTGDTLKAVAAAAVQMSVATGEGADQIAEKLIGAKDNVGKLAAEYNAQYHFMSAATYEQIAALEDQGRKMDALKLLSTSLASEMTARNEEIRASPRGIAAAWDDAKTALSGYWQQLKKGVTADPETFKLQVLQQQVEDAKSGFWFSDKARDAAIAPMQVEIDQIQKRQAAKAEEARQDAENQAKQQAAIKAEGELERTREQLASKAEQREKARAEYLDRVNTIKAAAPNSALVDPARVAKDLAAIDERYKDPAPKKAPKTPAVRDDAATRMLQQLREQQATLQEQLDSETKISEAQRQQAQFTQLIADLKGKTVLTAEQKSLLANQDAIKAQLAVNVALDEQIRKRKTLEQNARDNAALEADYLRGIGRNGDAAMLEISARFAQMQKEFQARGNDTGLALIDKLIPIEQARVRLDAVQAEIDKAFARQDRGEQSIDVQVNAGLLTEYEGRAKLLDLHRQTADVIEQYLPDLERMAQLPGLMGEQAQAALEKIRAQLAGLRNATTELQLALKNGLENGIQNALMGLAHGTMNLRDAVRSLVQSVADSMMQLAAKQLAQSATSGIMGLFGLGGGVAPVRRSTGGHVTGPGTTTSDSIPAMLSNWEYVTRAAVVQQPGALDFLHSFNVRGMAALDDYARRVRHATGGLAGVPAPPLPAPSLGNVQLAEPAKAMSATLKNSQTFILADDPSRILDAAWGNAGTERMIVALSRDPAKFRSILNL